MSNLLTDNRSWDYCNLGSVALAPQVTYILARDYASRKGSKNILFVVAAVSGGSNSVR